MIDTRRPEYPLVLRLLDIGKRDTGQDLKAIDQKPVFILSTGRTGTQFLAEHFDREPHIRALHEPVPSRGLKLWTVAYLDGTIDESTMVGALRRYRSGFFEGMSEPIYVESNNFLAGFAGALIEVFDDPVLVHVVRDPRTYVRSAVNHGASSGLKGLANRFVPFAHLDLEPGSDDPIVRRTARYWTLLNGYLQRVGRAYPNYHVFKYEELFHAGSDEFSRLAVVVGSQEPVLEARTADRPVNQSTGNVLPPWREWSEAQQAVVIDTCGELMAQFGYDE